MWDLKETKLYRRKSKIHLEYRADIYFFSEVRKMFSRFPMSKYDSQRDKIGTIYLGFNRAIPV